jgi:hypothetical protein
MRMDRFKALFVEVLGDIDDATLGEWFIDPHMKPTIKFPDGFEVDLNFVGGAPPAGDNHKNPEAIVTKNHPGTEVTHRAR